MLWHELQNLVQNGSGQIVGDVCVSPDSPWFDGHFPDTPVLPGIAQLGIIADAISKYSGNQVEIESIDRIRFKKIIQPGNDLKISVEPRPERPKSFAFRIMMEAELVCSGLMKIK